MPPDWKQRPETDTLIPGEPVAGEFMLVLATSGSATADTLHYHLRRAVFRCSSLNRCLANEVVVSLISATLPRP